MRVVDFSDDRIPVRPSPFALRYSLFAILLLTFALRFYCLSCSSYWHDEGNTWALVQRSFAQIAAAAAADIHPPGYYWLLKLWSLVFGHTPWALRAFSALTGTLTVAVVYAIGKVVSSYQLSVSSEQSSPVASPQSPIPNTQYPFSLFLPLFSPPSTPSKSSTARKRACTAC